MAHQLRNNCIQILAQPLTNMIISGKRTKPLLSPPRPGPQATFLSPLSDDLNLDELQLGMGDAKPQPSVQGSPTPGSFKPCEHLFESWGIRLAVWAIMLLSVLCNGLVLLSVFAGGPGPLAPVKFVVGAIPGTSTLTGISCGLLASVDTLTFGQ